MKLGKTTLNYVKSLSVQFCNINIIIIIVILLFMYKLCLLMLYNIIIIIVFINTGLQQDSFEKTLVFILF